MQTLSNFIASHASYAHFIIFSLLILSGFSLPISEEVVIIISAIIASTIIPANTYLIFIAIFLGCCCGDSICYWTGRIFGSKVLHWKWFKAVMPANIVCKLKIFYQKYALPTFLLGRFIPGGRNAMFLSAGISKMQYGKFVIYDVIAAFITNTTWFFTIYFVGHNYQKIILFVKKANLFLLIFFVVTFISLLCYYMVRKKNP
jgi:membrane protein DedA with SNARE-associated domain